jgi:undecaprenyl-diphosphatase
VILEWLKQTDIELFLFLYHLRHPYLTPFFSWVTNKWVWLPLYFYLFFLLYRNLGLRKTIGQFVIIVLLIFVSDNLASAVCKPYFERLRPCNEPFLAGKFSMEARPCSSSFSFVSSHAANSSEIFKISYPSLKFSFISLNLSRYRKVSSYACNLYLNMLTELCVRNKDCKSLNLCDAITLTANSINCYFVFFSIAYWYRPTRCIENIRSHRSEFAFPSFSAAETFFRQPSWQLIFTLLFCFI